MIIGNLHFCCCLLRGIVEEKIQLEKMVAELINVFNLKEFHKFKS